MEDWWLFWSIWKLDWHRTAPHPWIYPQSTTRVFVVWARPTSALNICSILVRNRCIVTQNYGASAPKAQFNTNLSPFKLQLNSISITNREMLVYLHLIPKCGTISQCVCSMCVSFPTSVGPNIFPSVVLTCQGISSAVHTCLPGAWLEIKVCIDFYEQSSMYNSPTFPYHLEWKYTFLRLPGVYSVRWNISNAEDKYVMNRAYNI
jgi:hypothetical protein